MSLQPASSPFIWIFFPALFGILLFNLRRWERAMTLAGIGMALLLAWLAWQMPVDQPITLGPWRFLPTLEIRDTLSIFGRRFVLGNSTRPVLLMIYLGLAFWFGGSYLARPGRMFIPLGFMISALLIAALSVEPFLYAALLIQIAALACVPILAPPGKPASSGVLRFLTLLTLGMPLILFAGWLQSRLGEAPETQVLTVITLVTIGLGFSFFAGIFPFHTWIPMLGEQAHPYSAAFVFFVVPGIVSMFILNFFSRTTWPENLAWIYAALRLLGLLMVLLGGAWAAFQRNLGRILGYAAMTEIGFSLMALGLGLESGPALLSIYFTQFLPRALGLGTAALALAVILRRLGSKPNALDFRQVQGIARQAPVASASLCLALFSLAGFPLLAGFPPRMGLWAALAPESLPLAVLSLAGSTGLLMSGVRILAVLITGPGEAEWTVTETRGQITLLVIGSASLLFVGLLPQWFYPTLAGFAQIFTAP